MKSLNEALELLLQSVTPVQATESLPVVDCAGRNLAQDITSLIDVPAYDNSQMDGYAGVAVEMNNAIEPMRISQRIPAGHPGIALEPGTVARIFTGAPIPPGANAVIMQEQAQVSEDGRVKFTEPASPGQNIRPMAGDLRMGQVMLNKGRRLSAADIGLVASVGQTHATVFRRLRVAVFSSGDELRQPGESLGFGQIYDSNRRMILALTSGLGCEVLDMGCIPDHLQQTRDRIEKAATQCDVLLTCGGVSVGEEDHIKTAIAALGSLDLWKVSIKPGKPFAFGRVGQATFMGMPGNPVAAWVTFCLLIRPYLLAKGGAQALPARAYPMPAGFAWPRPDSRQEYLRGWIDASGRVQIHERQNSSVLSSVTECQGLIEIPPSTPISKGEFVRFIPYTEFA